MLLDFLIYGTAYSALVTSAKIKKGETCLILGATGGVGIAAVEIAKALGSKVIACGGSDSKLKSCTSKVPTMSLIIKKRFLEMNLINLI